MSIKTEQLRFPRVLQAYTDKGAMVDKMLGSNNLITLVAYKQERELELWAGTGNAPLTRGKAFPFNKKGNKIFKQVPLKNKK